MVGTAGAADLRGLARRIARASWAPRVLLVGSAKEDPIGSRKDRSLMLFLVWSLDDPSVQTRLAELDRVRLARWQNTIRRQP